MVLCSVIAALPPLRHTTTGRRPSQKEMKWTRHVTKVYRNTSCLSYWETAEICLVKHPIFYVRRHSYHYSPRKLYPSKIFVRKTYSGIQEQYISWENVFTYTFFGTKFAQQTISWRIFGKVVWAYKSWWEAAGHLAEEKFCCWTLCGITCWSLHFILL